MQRDTQIGKNTKVKGTGIQVCKHNTQTGTSKYETVYIRHHAY